MFKKIILSIFTVVVFNNLFSAEDPDIIAKLLVTIGSIKIFGGKSDSQELKDMINLMINYIPGEEIKITYSDIYSKICNYLWFSNLNYLSDNSLKDSLLAMYTSNDINKSCVAAFFLGMFDFCKWQHFNASRFFEYAYKNSENILLKNWATFMFIECRLKLPNPSVNLKVLFEGLDVHYINLENLKTKLEQVFPSQA